MTRIARVVSAMAACSWCRAHGRISSGSESWMVTARRRRRRSGLKRRSGSPRPRPRDLAGGEVLDGARRLAAAARVADAHAAAELGLSPAPLCLLEQRGAAVVKPQVRSPRSGSSPRRRRSAVPASAERSSRRAAAIQAFGRPCLADGVEQRRAGRRRRSRRARSRARLRELARLKWPSASPDAGRPRVGASQAHVGTGGGDPLELLAVDRALGIGREVQEGDRTAMTLGAERSQHRHHRGDPAAAADQKDALGPLVGKMEVAGGLLEREQHPGGARWIRKFETRPSGWHLTVSSSSRPARRPRRASSSGRAARRRSPRRPGRTGRLGSPPRPGWRAGST